MTPRSPKTDAYIEEFLDALFEVSDANARPYGALWNWVDMLVKACAFSGYEKLVDKFYEPNVFLRQRELAPVSLICAKYPGSDHPDDPWRRALRRVSREQGLELVRQFAFRWKLRAFNDYLQEDETVAP